MVSTPLPAQAFSVEGPALTLQRTGFYLFIYLFSFFSIFFMLPIISKCLRKCGYDYCIENMSLLPLKCKRLPNQPESRTTFPHLL